MKGIDKILLLISLILFIFPIGVFSYFTFIYEEPLNCDNSNEWTIREITNESVVFRVRCPPHITSPLNETYFYFVSLESSLEEKIFINNLSKNISYIDRDSDGFYSVGDEIIINKSYIIQNKIFVVEIRKTRNQSLGIYYWSGDLSDHGIYTD